MKAHISTPYIDADGRGTRGAYAKDEAACMLDPAAFRALEGGGPAADSKLLSTLEVGERAVFSRAEDKSANIRAAEAQRVAAGNAAAADEMEAVGQRRAAAREAGREADANEHFLLYQRRNESERALQAFENSLKPSAEATVRDREESVGRRHRELMALRQRANARQTDAISAEDSRRAAAVAQGEAALARKLSEQAEADRAAMVESCKAEFEAIVRERERQTQIRRLEESVRLKQEVQFSLWARGRDEALATAQRLSEAATAAEQAAHEAELEAHNAIADRSYGAMKALHARLEAMCATLAVEINKVNKSGSCLGMLMAVAKEKATARGVPFRALCRVCEGTYAPTVYTPEVVPRPEVLSATVACQTNVSEPVRPVSQQKGRRI